MYTAGYIGLLFLFCLTCSHAAPDPGMAVSNMEIESADTDYDQLRQETARSEEVASHETGQGIAALNNYIAKLMYQNDWDGRLSYKCPSGEGFYRVKSKHDNGKEDRRWEFYCRKVVQCGHSTCTTTSHINNFRDYISFMCGPNKYMAGVTSYHDNSKEDRIWRITCCSASSYITRNCRLTNYVNTLDQPMNFVANTGEVITGVFSYYSTLTRDRQWKYEVCRYEEQKQLSSLDIQD